MKHSLIKSFLFVWLFWWVTAFLFTPYNVGSVGLLPSLIHGAIFLFIALVVGTVVMLTYQKSELEKMREDTQPSTENGLIVGIGKMPIFSSPERASSYVIPADLVDWYKRYKALHPEYAAVFDAVLMIYEAKPVPASPVKGGHGGLNLRDHSFNVLREILATKDSFTFEGSKTKDGKIRHALNDKSYVFDAKDPAIPLLGFIHDLGKIVCYKPLANGLVEEIRVNHDIQGSRVLIGLPEFKELTKDNQELKNSLSAVMAYYHHPVEMPLWASDHTRALTELLIVADNSAGEKEGGVIVDYTSSNGDVIEVNSQTGVLELIAENSNGEFNLQDIVPPENVIIENETPDMTLPADIPAAAPVIAKPVEAPAVRVEQQAPSVSKSKSAAKYERKATAPTGNGLTPGFKENDVTPKNLSLGKTIYEGLIEALIKNPDLLSDKQGSIGFIKDKLYYIHDLSLRELLLKKYGDSKLLVNGKKNIQNPYTYALLTYLMHNDWLYCVHAGKNYSSKRAMFTVNKLKVSDNKRVLEKTMSYMIVVNEEAFINKGIPFIKGTRLNIEIVKATGGGDFKLNEGMGDDDAEEDMYSDDELAGMEIAISSDKIDQKKQQEPRGETHAEQESSDTTTQQLEPIQPVTPSASPDLLDDILGMDLLDETVTATEPHQPDAAKPAILDEMSSQDSIDNDLSMEVEDEPQYIDPEERFGVLAIIAKLQYSNNKKLSPLEVFTSPSNTEYLLYDVNQVCLKFKYSEADLKKDTIDYCEKNQSKRIGLMPYPSGKNNKTTVFFVKMADENEVNSEM